MSLLSTIPSWPASSFSVIMSSSEADNDNTNPSSACLRVWVAIAPAPEFSGSKLAMASALVWNLSKAAFFTFWHTLCQGMSASSVFFPEPTATAVFVDDDASGAIDAIGAFACEPPGC